MLVRSLSLGALRTNCYVIIDEENNNCLLVDPGDEADRIIRLFTKEGLKPLAILLTHGHFDHVGAVAKLVENYRIPVVAGEKELELMKDPELNLSHRFGDAMMVVPSHVVGDDEDLTVGEFACKVLETPGHTKGSVTFYFEKLGAAFTGDTLFFESVGRSDFPTGNDKKLVESIKDKLFLLPKKTVIYPGHGPQTTVEYEMKNNPYLY